MVEEPSGAQETATAEERDGAAVRFPPPFVPVLLLIVGLVIEYFVGAFVGTPIGFARYLFAGVLMIGGFAFMMMAMGLFRATGQDPKPWESSPELIAEGIYTWTRNPMYLGMGFLQAGLGLLFGSLWPLVLVPVTWGIIYRIAIRHEEAYLERKFGSSYLEYKESVRRWL